MTSTDFGKHLATFLTQYLPGQRGVGENTIRSYRDVFVLLLRYCRDERGWPPEKLCLKKLNDAVIMEFWSTCRKNAGAVSELATIALLLCTASSDTFKQKCRNAFCSVSEFWRYPLIDIHVVRSDTFCLTTWRSFLLNQIGRPR